jgi:hypothetical protein
LQVGREGRKEGGVDVLVERSDRGEIERERERERVEMKVVWDE